ncbi:MAG TPA: ATP-binding protein [Thermoanaerobaculia bacterium]|nr:ATP-binding protein [Thermoanaerobaculia bacterium]
MSDEIPLGKREDLHLEFKGADALKDPEKIAREVVAMLNADGGEVWVGVREEEGRAVLAEPIPDAEKESRRLHDFLVDVIEPPLSEEISVSVEGRLLRLAAHPASGRKPYAFLKKGGRHYVIRTGDRIRPMTRDEIFARPTGGEAGFERAEAAILAARNQVLAEGRQVLWLRFEPGPPVSLDVQAARLKGVLQDPRVSGNRPTGWHFSQFSSRPRIQQDALLATDDHRKVEVRRDGGLVFNVLLAALFWKGEESEIWPPLLLEYVVSAFRMARVIYLDALRPRDPVVVDLVLAGARGWKLRTGWLPRPRVMQSDDLVLTQPLTFRFREIAEGPDRCGYRLIERVYEAFGIRREGIPDLFDPESGRLVLPE